MHWPCLCNGAHVHCIVQRFVICRHVLSPLYHRGKCFLCNQWLFSRHFSVVLSCFLCSNEQLLILEHFLPSKMIKTLLKTWCLKFFSISGFGHGLSDWNEWWVTQTVDCCWWHGIQQTEKRDFVIYGTVDNLTHSLYFGLATKRNLFHGAYALLVFSDIIHTLDCLHLFLFAPKIRKRVGSVKWCQKARKRNNSRVQNWCDRQTNVYNTIMMTWWQNNSLLMAWRNGTWDECTDRKRWFGKHTHKTNHIMLLNGFTNTMKSISQLKWVGTESKIEQ